MFSILLLLLPLTTIAQWGTPPPIVTNQQCQEEYDKIIGCVRNGSLFSSVDDIPLHNKQLNQELIQEITHVLDCSGFLNCNSSRILQSFFFNQRWILDHYYDNLETCLTIDAQIAMEKECLLPVPSGSHWNCNFITNNLKCLSESLKKQPNCGPKDVRPYQRLLWAVRASCVMGYQWKIETKNYKLKEKKILQ
uniref:DUF19 domain-containing protein n=1 Tax=Caenorhabditis tropicalis TaxID=1561998 RepID=A0A1I7UV07_9PELO